MKKIFIYTAMVLLPLSGYANSNNYNMSNENVSEKTIKKTRSQEFIIDSETEWENVDKGVSRKIMGYDGQVMLVKVKFEKGAVGTPHSHYHTQTTYVASGKFEFDIEGKKKVVSAGDGIYIEPDANHGCVCLEPGVLIDCFAPMRFDFLK